jgi:hypothetical protein
MVVFIHYCDHTLKGIKTSWESGMNDGIYSMNPHSHSLGNVKAGMISNHTGTGVAQALPVDEREHHLIPQVWDCSKPEPMRQLQVTQANIRALERKMEHNKRGNKWKQGLCKIYETPIQKICRPVVIVSL